MKSLIVHHQSCNILGNMKLVNSSLVSNQESIFLIAAIDC